MFPSNRSFSAVATACAVVAALAMASLPISSAFAQGAPGIFWFGAGQAAIDVVVYSPDGTLLATGSDTEGTVKIWNVASGDLIRTIVARHGYVAGLAFSEDGNLLATAGEALFGAADDAVAIWRVSDGSLVRSFATDFHNANGVVFGPGATTLIAAVGSEARLWRIADGALLRTFTGHDFTVFAVALSPDGQTLATASGDKTAKLWRVSDGTLLHTLRGHEFLVVTVAFAPDGQTLATGSWDHFVKLWRVSDGAQLRSLGGHSAAVTSVAFNSSGNLLATSGQDGVIVLWNPENGTPVRRFTDAAIPSVESVAFTPDDTEVAAGSLDGHPRFWNVADDRLAWTLGHHTAAISSVAMSHDGELAASGAYDREVRVWNAADGTELRTLSGHEDVVNAVAFAPGDLLLASCGGSPPPDTRDATIRIWRVADGSLVQVLPGHPGGTTDLGFTPDGNFIVSGGRDDLLKIWRVADGTLVRALAGHANWVNSVAVSPDGARAASGSFDGTVRLWRLSDGELLDTLTHSTHNAVESVAWSPDASQIVAGEAGYGENAVLWSADDGTILRAWPALEAFVTTVAFAPDGHEIATTSGYTFEIRLWNSDSGELLRRYDRETGAGRVPVLPLAFSDDGAVFLYGRSDATLVLARNPLSPATAAPSASHPPSVATVLGPRPNPFNPRTSFELRLLVDAHVSFDLYDLRGRHVFQLLDSKLTAGEHDLSWDGRDAAGHSLSSGAYLYRLRIDGRPAAAGKAMLVK